MICIVQLSFSLWEVKSLKRLLLRVMVLLVENTLRASTSMLPSSTPSVEREGDEIVRVSSSISASLVWTGVGGDELFILLV